MKIGGCCAMDQRLHFGSILDPTDPAADPAADPADAGADAAGAADPAAVGADPAAGEFPGK